MKSRTFCGQYMQLYLHNIKNVSVNYNVENDYSAMENNLRIEHNSSMQSHFFPSTDEMQPKSDSSSFELTHVGIGGENIVAPPLEVNDNYKYIEEGVEIRSLQSNHGNLLDPSSDVPTRSKVNTILRNVGSTDVLISIHAQDRAHVSLNLGHLNAVEREDLKSSPVEKKPRKRALTNTDVQSSKHVITKATSGESTGRKKKSLAISETDAFHDLTSSIQTSRHPEFNKLTTDGVELSTRVSYETDNSQRPQSIVTPTTTVATFTNASNQLLVKNNLLEKLLLDIPVVLSAAANGTEELRSSARPESVKLWKASVDDINVENRRFQNFYHFRRSASQPDLRLGQQSKPGKLTKTETSELVVEGQGNLRELRHGNRKRVTDRSVSSDVKTVPKRYNFAKSDIPSNKSLKTNTLKKLIIRQPKYREFSSLEMAKGASAVQYKEELVQEPVSLIRQIVKVHSSVIPSGNKPKVNFPSVLYKPELPPKPVHLSAIGSVRQVRPSCLINYGPLVKPRGSIPVNTASTATLPGAKNQFLLLSNNNNTSHDSTWEQGCTNNRLKTVRILNSADNCKNGKISDVSAARGPAIDRSVKNKTDSESQNVVMSLKQKKPASVQNYVEQMCSPSPRYEKKKDKSSPSDKYRKTITHEYPSLIHTQKKLSLPSSTLTPCIKAQDKYRNRNKDEGSAGSTPQDNFTSKCLKPKNLEFSSSQLPISSNCLLPDKENLTDRIERITGYKAAEKYSSSKPPLPLHFQNATKARLNAGIRTRIANARQQFLEAIQNSEERKFDYRSQDGDLDKFKAFRRSTEAERARLIASTPDLAALERSVRSSRRHIDRILASKGRSQLETESERSHSEPRHADGSAVVWPSYRRKISQYKDKYEHERYLKRRSKSFGYLETDIDTLECRQVFETEHDRSRRENHLYNAYFTRSLFTLDQQNLTNHTTEMEDNSRARSMDFLLDDDNRLSVLPPENTLNANKTKSEHELRVERSLQNLNIPEWYKNSPWSKKSQEKLILKHNNGKRRPRWQGLGSRTPSSSSIASNSFSSRNLRTPDRSVNTDWRYTEFLRSSRESLTEVSTGSVSPAEPYPLSRWSSTRLSSTSFPVSGWSAYRSFRQPYLGWRAAIGQNSSSNFSGVPSPAPSTPLTTSRPVSPGRSFREYQSDYTNLSDKSEIQISSHHRIEDVKKDDLLANFSDQLGTCSQHVNTVEKGSNYNVSRSNFTKSKQISLLQYHPTSNSETINGHSDLYHETSRSYNYVRAESAQLYSESTDDGSPYQQSCSTLEKDFTFPSYSKRIYDYPVETSIPTKVYTAESLLSQSSIRPSGEKPHPDCRNRNIYQNKNSSLQKDMFSYHTPVNSNSSPCYLKKSFVNETGYYQSSYLPDEKKDDSFTIVTSEFSHPDQEPRILEDSNTEQKTSMNGYREESRKALKELENSSLSINHDFGDGSESPIERNPKRDRSSYAQSIYNGDPKRDRFSYIQSIYNGDSIVDKVTKKGSRQPTSDGQQTFVDISQNRNQSQTSSPQRVLWMESSFVGSRPTTSVVVMPANNDKLLFEKTNVVYNTDDENDSLQYQHDLNDFEEKREEIITSLDDVLDALLAIPSSSRSSSPVTSRRTSPVASQMISSAQVDREEQPPFFSDWTENTDGRQNSKADKTSYPTMSVSSCTGSQEPPSRRLSEVSSHGSTTADENRYSSSSAISLEPELEHSLREKYDAKSKEEMFRSEERLSSKQESGQQEEPSPLKPPDTKHLRHSFPETVHQATSSSVISKRDSTLDEPHQQRGTITCNRPKCTKTLPMEEGRVKFRMCPNCYTYYCSRHCRKIHWDRHKNQCPYTKISNLCQQVLVKVRQDPISRRNLSVCARRGYLSRGRGAVKLVFYNTEDALDFMCKGWNSIRGQNFYVPRGDLMPQEMGADMFTYIRNLCDRYNPGKKFVLLAAVRVTQEISSVAGPLIEREIIIRGTKMRLTLPLPEDDVQMVILTLAKHPGSDVAERHRQCLAMENHLQERGINIATEFPDMYAKIKNFVKGGEPFVPLSVFLTDRRTAKMFMCIILPWADAEIIQNISAKAAVTKSKRLWML
ncbi:uncharacterized protein LOC143252123 isoform X2 [Tachypleus tridentatus]|uniref:uncharacterized protein LOC143252123 isoform X2 n=1 Tax=Tachypleus tridentatus TaxID=6853 RepID=UPI003FD0816E